MLQRVTVFPYGMTISAPLGHAFFFFRSRQWGFLPSFTISPPHEPKNVLQEQTPDAM
jgi:hypothetical protein